MCLWFSFVWMGPSIVMFKISGFGGVLGERGSSLPI